MSAVPTAVAEKQEEHHGAGAPLSAILAGIDSCLRRWKASRDEGQAILTELSNALLLRTYVDKGRRLGGDGDDGSSKVWGALAHAGASVSRVSIAAEARARRLHGDLSALQDAMLAAAGGIRRHAQEARRRCCGSNPAAQGESLRHPSGGGGGGGGGNVSAAQCLDAKPVRSAAAAAAAIGGVLVETGDSEGGSVIGGGFGLMDLADAASEVAEMLLKEGFVTATVAQGVGQESNREDREALTVYAAAWMMQPYVDVRRIKELETMVRGRERGRV